MVKVVFNEQLLSRPFNFFQFNTKKQIDVYFTIPFQVRAFRGL